MTLKIMPRTDSTGKIPKDSMLGTLKFGKTTLIASLMVYAESFVVPINSIMILKMKRDKTVSKNLSTNKRP